MLQRNIDLNRKLWALVPLKSFALRCGGVLAKLHPQISGEPS
jgi:hypothetical protein